MQYSDDVYEVNAMQCNTVIDYDDYSVFLRICRIGFDRFNHHCVTQNLINNCLISTRFNYHKSAN